MKVSSVKDDCQRSKEETHKRGGILTNTHTHTHIYIYIYIYTEKASEAYTCTKS